MEKGLRSGSSSKKLGIVVQLEFHGLKIIYYLYFIF